MGNGNYSQAIFVISTIIGLLLQMYFIQYMVHLEQIGCRCARGWDYYYIFVYVALMFIYECYFGYELLTAGITKTIKLSAVLHLPVFLATIMFIVAIFMYLRRVKREKCECSADVARDVMELLAKIYVTVFGIVIIYCIFLVIMMSVGN